MATITEIARKLGVSHTLVSKALNGGRSTVVVSDVQRERIRSAAREMGYRPNASARSMRRGSFNSVTLLLSTIAYRSWISFRLLDGVHDALAERGMTLNLAKLPDDKLTAEQYMPQILRERMSDGLLVNMLSDIPPKMVELIDRYKLPAVWMNQKRDADCVYPDDESAAYLATRKLLALGHREIAYLDYSNPVNPGHYSAIDRPAGYTRAMREAGLGPRLLVAGQLPPTARTARCRQWLGATDRPTAVIAYSPANAMPVFQAAGETRVRVPQDLVLVTFHDQAIFTEGDGAPFGTITHPLREIGRRAVHMLLAKIDKPARVLPAEAIAYDLSDDPAWGTPID